MRKRVTVGLARPGRNDERHRRGQHVQLFEERELWGRSRQCVVVTDDLVPDLCEQGQYTMTCYADEKAMKLMLVRKSDLQ